MCKELIQSSHQHQNPVRHEAVRERGGGMEDGEKERENERAATTAAAVLFKLTRYVQGLLENSPTEAQH